jgi:hypothetical protein
MFITRALGGVVALSCVGLLSSCAFLPDPVGASLDNEDQQVNVEMQHIADAVKHHDAAALTKLFSQTAREKATDLDAGLKYFLSVFPSGRVTWTSLGNGGTGDDEDGKQTTVVFAFYKVPANGKTYEVYFADYTVNQVDDPHNVGIYALGVALYNPHPSTAPTPASNAFYKWTSQFEIVDHKATGTPGVYIPKT